MFRVMLDVLGSGPRARRRKASPLSAENSNADGSQTAGSQPWVQEATGPGGYAVEPSARVSDTPGLN